LRNGMVQKQTISGNKAGKELAIKVVSTDEQAKATFGEVER